MIRGQLTLEEPGLISSLINYQLTALRCGVGVAQFNYLELFGLTITLEHNVGTCVVFIWP